MNKAWVGIGIFGLGYLVCFIFAGIFGTEEVVVSAILYLAAVVVVCTLSVILELRKIRAKTDSKQRIH